MKILLKSISLINFKGIRSFTANFNNTTNIYGENATGKTSLFDAFTWLLFGKDSSDSKDFAIKTLNDQNIEIPQIEHEVAALLEVDGQDVSLRRILKEKWTKKRGSAEAEFTGNETEFFWNDVPLKAGEYQAKIAGIVDETLFKLITNTLYFNSMKWQDRRAVLMNIAGNISNDEIFDQITTIQNKGEIGNLIDVINSGKTLAEYKKEIGARKKLLSDNLKTIPTRIDEATRSMPVASDFAALEAQKADIQTEIANIDQQMMDATKALQAHHAAINVRQNNLQGIKTQLRDVESSIRQEFTQARKNRENAISLKNSEANGEANLIKNIQSQLTGYQSQRDRIEATRQTLLAKWHETNNKQLVIDPNDLVCPTCNRDLDADTAHEHEQMLTENFNTQKATALEEISTQGKQFKTQIEELDATIADLSKQLQTHSDNHTNIQHDLITLREEDATSSSNEQSLLATAITENADVIVLKKQIEALELEISIAQQTDQRTDLQPTKQNLNLQLEAVNRELAVKDQIEKVNARIKELNKENKDLAQQLADLEKTEFHIDRFTRAKMDTLEARINGRFNMVRFKLFQTNINGGEEECCQTLVNTNGSYVEFQSVNNAGKINAGLDIINTLCEHHNVYAPIFVDNRESVNQLITSPTQIINLIVSTDKQLRVA